MNVLEVLKDLSNIFENAGYEIFAVGGTVRDYLLKKDVTDFDFVTDATPQEIKGFLSNCDATFEKYGIINYQLEDVKLQIATFRIEKNYSDFRHPAEIVFVRSMEEDYLRRDFTINALYLDKDGKVYDFCHGLDDLNQKKIRMIGNADERIKEDPLRILRGIRFAHSLKFEIDDDLSKAMKVNFNLLKKINSQKILEEIRKMNINLYEDNKGFREFIITLLSNFH